MIRNCFLRQLAIAAGLIFTIGSVDLHAEQNSDIEAVTVANHAFDTALSARDVKAMERVWATEPYVIAVPPASKVLIVGWDAVCEFGSARSITRPTLQYSGKSGQSL